ncbi:MAG: hypothetical protein AAFW82_05270 [Pseudomonadota bacterium]
MNKNSPEGRIEFGAMPPAVDEILQHSVSLYQHDREAADTGFRNAIALDPTALPGYLCLYKTYTYQGRLDEAYRIALSGLEEAARQAGWPSDWQLWTQELVGGADSQPARFCLYTLKALSFIHLKRKQVADSRRILAKLDELGHLEEVGGTVMADLADALDA